MVEIRKEITKDEWAIIAPTRSNRPFDFSNKAEQSENRRDSDCPFCPGNEDNTPPESYAIREGQNQGESDWKVRVFPNKYSALNQDDTAAVIEGDIFKSMGGFGYHEVIAETQRHNTSLTNLNTEKIELVIQTYIERAKNLSSNPEIKYVNIFRNQGKRAGASLSHPHSQIMATPFVPKLIKTEYLVAKTFYDQKGGCLYCQILEEEKTEEQRIIFENDGFVVLAPFGSRFPYETHLYPKEHLSRFTELKSNEISQFAKTLKLTLEAMSEKLVNFFPYNYSIHTAPSKPLNDFQNLDQKYHWHLEIIPRLTTPAGFELGSGNFINIVKPEHAAKELRSKLD